MGFLSLLGFGNSLKKVLREGAFIVDVRTSNEYDQGRVPGSFNIPVDRLSISIERIKSFGRPVIFVSSGDARSTDATRFCKSKGLKNVYNGGSWKTILKMKQRIN